MSAIVLFPDIAASGGEFLYALRRLDARKRSGDASAFTDATLSLFIRYPVLALHFILLTPAIIGIYAGINRPPNRHLPAGNRPRIRAKPQLVR